MVSVTYYFDFGSPNAFLAHRVIPGIAARTGARFDYVPVLLGGLFKLTGNQSPVTAFASIKNKPQYEMLEMRRFIARHGIVDFRMNPFFPINTLGLMRGAVAAQRLGVLDAYVGRIFDDMWTRELNLGDGAVVAASLQVAGLPAAIVDLAQTPEVKQALGDNTQAAFERGAFGIPSFVVDDALYFGKDRLRDVEDALLGR